jgi:hypothetical protein
MVLLGESYSDVILRLVEVEIVQISDIPQLLSFARPSGACVSSGLAYAKDACESAGR